MANPETDPDGQAPEPANLKFLRRLVTTLTAAMLVGVVVIVALLVMRFRDAPPELPSSILLPDGAKPLAFTQGPSWYAIVTDTDMILIYDRVTGQLKQTVRIE